MIDTSVFITIWAQLLAQGAKIGVMDALIAATAVAHGYSLLAEGLAHVGRVPGLTVQAPRWG